MTAITPEMIKEAAMTAITPEMIKAGVHAYRRAHGRVQSDEDIVTEIYAVMRVAVDRREGNPVTSPTSLAGMLGITAYKIPEVDNPKENPMIGCPFLDANTPERARDVLREGMADWHAGEAVWQEFIDKILSAVADAPPIAVASVDPEVRRGDWRNGNA